MTRSRIRKQAAPLPRGKDRWPVIELSRRDRWAIERHFLALDREDRRLRFGTPSSDDWIRSYLEGIDFGRDSVFGVFDKAWQLIGVAHLGRTPEAVEVGLSVLPAHRNLGIGSSLVERAGLRARSWGVRRLIVQFAGDNGAMKHLAAKHGLALEYDRGDVLGALDLCASAAAPPRRTGTAAPRQNAWPTSSTSGR